MKQRTRTKKSPIVSRGESKSLRSAPISPRRSAGTTAVMAFALAFLLSLSVPWQPIREEAIGYFDYSWMLVLHHAIATGMQFGKQLVLPYGPLGFIAAGVYDPRTFLVLALARVALAAGAFAGLWAIARKFLPQPLMALPWMMAIAAVMSESPDHFFPLCAVLLLVDYFLVNQRAPSLSVFVLVVILSAASLMKVNLFCQAIVVVAAVTADQLIRGRYRLEIPAIYAGSVTAFYLAARQSPASAAAFVKGWASTSGGHMEAMALPGAGIDVFLFLAVAALALFVAASVAWRQSRYAGAVPVLALAGVLAILYKHSFVRQDFAHATLGPMAAFAVALIYLPIVFRLFAHRALRGIAIGSVALAGVVASSSLTGYRGDNLAAWAGRALMRSAAGISAAASDLADPSHLARAREENRAMLRSQNSIALDRVRGSVDVYPDRADVVLAYGLAYTPRPCVLSLMACSPALEDLDARFLQGPSAPESILFNVDPADGNFPSLMDAASWPELLTRYDIIDTSGAFLLLQRSANPRQYHLNRLVTLAARMNEPLAIPDAETAPLWARIIFKKRLGGRILSALYKPPEVYLKVRTRDGADRAFRLRTALAEHGFLLSPLMRCDDEHGNQGRADFASLAGKSWARDLQGAFVQSVTIAPGDDSLGAYFIPEIAVELDRLEFPRQDRPIKPVVATNRTSRAERSR